MTNIEEINQKIKELEEEIARLKSVTQDEIDKNNCENGRCECEFECRHIGYY